jgi:hypothetical protein
MSQQRNQEELFNEDQQPLSSLQNLKNEVLDADDLVHRIGIEKSGKREELDADEVVHKMRPSAPRNSKLMDPDDLVHGE